MKTSKLLLCSLLAGAFSVVCGAAEPKSHVAINDITREPEKFIGKQVTVSGKVDDVNGQKIATLDDHKLFSNVLLVVSHKPLGDVSKDSERQFTGVVRMMDADQARRELKVDLDRKLEAHLQGGIPVLVVDSAQHARVPASKRR